MNQLTKPILLLLNNELESLAQEYTAQLRVNAAAAGWPNIVYLQISIIVKDGKFTIQYPNAIDSSVKNLEYGTGDTSPSPVLRTFMRTIDTSRGSN